MCYVTHGRNVLFNVLGLGTFDTVLKEKFVYIFGFFVKRKLLLSLCFVLTNPPESSLPLFHEWKLELNSCIYETKC